MLLGIKQVNISASGSLAVGFTALFFALMQFSLHFLQKEERWHVWIGLISLSTSIYSFAVFAQYFLGPVNANILCERIQYTSVIVLLHCIYGFTFSYLKINSKPYHLLAGPFHAILLILLWTTRIIISNDFVFRDFLFLSRPYVEPALAPTAIFLFLYICAGIIMIPYIWNRHKAEDQASSALFMIGFSIWVLFALHDSIVTVFDLVSVQFLVEYGFLAFCVSLVFVSVKKNVDLTKLSRIQAQRLEKEAERYRMASEVVFDFAYFFRIAGPNRLEYEWVLGSIEKITGYSAKELALKSTRLRMIHPEDRIRVREYTSRIRKGEQAVVEFRIHKKDGTLRWLKDHGRPVFEPGGKTISGIYGAIKDITDQRIAELALAESERKYRLVVENANDAIVIINEGFICFANPMAENLSGYSEKALSKTPFLNLIHPDDREIVRTNYRKLLSGEKFPNIYKFRIINKNGQVVWVQVNGVRIDWEGKPATLNFLRDITEQLKIEEELRNAERLKAIAILSGGVAHEFNNALSVVMGNLELLEFRLHPESPIRSEIRPILRACRRMAELCKKLVAFARGGKYVPQKLVLNSVIESILSDFDGRSGKEIEFRVDLAQDLYYVEADPEQMRMMVNAVLTNAVESISQKGSITVETRNCAENTAEGLPGNFKNKEDSDDIYSGEHTGFCVRFLVSDTGIGMDSETLSKIFDPFFTTKFQGRGMGMAAVYGIVKGYGGKIHVESEPGKGSHVAIYLPAKPD